MKTIILPLTLALTATLSGCLGFATQKQTQSQIITSARTNIATSRQPSNQVSTVLLTSGYPDLQSCLMAFDKCLDDVNAGFFDPQINRHRLALFAELHYAHALHWGNMDACKKLDRPPIDPYYANAPKTQEQLDLEHQNRQTCFDNYRSALYQAINHSYGYLFFNELTGSQHAQNITEETTSKPKTSIIWRPTHSSARFISRIMGLFLTPFKTPKIPTSPMTMNNCTPTAMMWVVRWCIYMWIMTPFF